MSTTTTLLDHQKGKVASEGLLGRLVWATVPITTRLDPQAVGVRLKELGFTRRIPAKPSESNVFRRITKKADRHGLPVKHDETQFENIRLIDINSPRDNLLVRRVVVERVDPRGRRIKTDEGLDFEQVADIEFHYDITRSPNVGVTKVTWHNGFSPQTHPQAAKVIQEIKDDFNYWKGMFHDEVIRHWITQSFIDMGAVAVKKGMYFLEEKYADQLEALETFVAEMLPNDADCHTIELVDTDKQREMIRRAIVEETTGAVEAMMAKIAKIRADGKLTPQLYLKMTSEVTTLKAKMSNYSALLSADLHALDVRTNLLESMVKGLSGIQRKKTYKRKDHGDASDETSEGRDEEPMESGGDAGTEGVDKTV